jgi:hypothetical protein
MKLFVLFITTNLITFVHITKTTSITMSTAFLTIFTFVVPELLDLMVGLGNKYPKQLLNSAVHKVLFSDSTVRL